MSTPTTKPDAVRRNFQIHRIGHHACSTPQIMPVWMIVRTGGVGVSVAGLN